MQNRWVLFKKKAQQVGYGSLSHCLINNNFHSEIPASSQLFHHSTTSYTFSLLKEMITPEAFHSRTHSCKSDSATMSAAHRWTGKNGKPFPWEFIRMLRVEEFHSRAGVACGKAAVLKMMLLAPVLLFGLSGRSCIVPDKLFILWFFILTVMWGFPRVPGLVVPWYVTPQYEHSQRLFWMLSMETGIWGLFLNNIVKNSKS